MSSDPEGDPEDLIRQGNELRKQGKSEQALPFYRAAYAAARTPRTAGQLGLAEISVGYWVEAEKHLAEALKYPGHPWVAKNIQTLRAQLADARQKVAEIAISGEPAGAEVRVNGHLVGTLPLSRPLRLAEGQVDIRVSAPGSKPETRTLSATGGEKLQVTVSLEEDPVPARTESRAGAPGVEPPAGAGDGARSSAAAGATTLTARGEADTQTSASAGSRWPAFMTAGLGVIALGFGAFEIYAWQHNQNAFNDHQVPVAGMPGKYQNDCGEGLPMRGGVGCQTLYDDAVSSRTLAIVGLAAGAALGVVTAVLLWTSHDDSNQDQDQRLSCAPDPVGRGMACRWRF